MTTHSKIHAGEVVHELNAGHRRWRSTSQLIVVHGSSRRRRAGEDSVESWGEGGLAARLFVGLNVGDKPTYSVEDVLHEVAKLRDKAGLPADSSFIAQKGLYTEPSGHLVEENSVQIIMFDATGSTPEDFERQIVQLARALREKLDQDSIIVEVQNRGVVQKVLAVKR